MNPFDFERARRYALARLERELSPLLTYHSLEHTRDDVVPAAERLAALEGVAGEALLLLRTAAWFHDLGFIEQPGNGHEAISARIAAEALPQFGYSPEQILTVSNIILATRIPQSPTTPLAEIMADADLDLLGRDDFGALNQVLWAERAALGEPLDQEAWYSSQLAFLSAHQYFTPSARALRNAGKQRNVAALKAWLERSRAGVANGPVQDAGEAEAILSASARIALLRSVSLFAEIPEAVLANVAALLRPLEFRAGETVFNKGDCGDCMYVIVDGRVRVHNGELVLNYLGACDVFGEMALLDTKSRVASVTAVEDTRLLRLDQAPFYELLANQTGVALGLIRVLNRHLRARVRDMVEDFEYMQQMARITAAAAALESGRYDPRSLDEVAQRTDELGQLAQVFQRMADEVVARELRLKQEVQQLRIQIDEEKRKQQVAEITESDYFRVIQQKAREIRNK